MKNWTVQCDGKRSEQDVKKGGEKGTYNLWKPGMGNSSRKLLALHHLGLKTEKIMVSDKVEAKTISFKITLGLVVSSGLELTYSYRRAV